MENNTINENIEQIEEKAESKLREFIIKNRAAITAGALAGGGYLIGMNLGRWVGRREGFAKGYVFGHSDCFKEIVESANKNK